MTTTTLYKTNFPLLNTLNWIRRFHNRWSSVLLFYWCKARFTPLTRCGNSNVPLSFICRDWSCHGDYFLPDLYLLQRCYILESSVSIPLLCFCCPVEILWQFVEHCKLQVNNDIKKLYFCCKKTILLNISISKQFLSSFFSFSWRKWRQSLLSKISTLENMSFITTMTSVVITL